MQDRSCVNDVEGVIRARGVWLEIPNAVGIAYRISEAHLFKQEAQCHRFQINKIQSAGCGLKLQVASG